MSGIPQEPQTGVGPESAGPEVVRDFRVQRLRRSLKDGATPAARAVAAKYAADGLAEAQFVLGQMESQSELPEARAAAKRWYEAAAAQGHKEACLALWGTALQEGIETAGAESIPFLLKLAEFGNEDARLMLVERYAITGDAEQFPKMLQYLKENVDQGSARGQRLLAVAYYQGYYGLTPDRGKAFELFLLSAKQGYAFAQRDVAWLYNYGHGVARDLDQAYYWYCKAAAAGHADAQFTLGLWYEVGVGPVKQSIQEANRWYRRAALRDNALAQYHLGISYLRGLGMPQNLTLANRWFERSAQQGCADAQEKLGRSYEFGLGVPVSPEKAVEFYALAARAGYAEGQVSYADMLLAGNGVPQNSAEALRWYQAAADQGFAAAEHNLGVLYLHGRAVEKDTGKALDCFRSAAEKGLATSQSNLAWMHETGTGVPQDRNEALRLYRLSAEQGCESGREGVARLLATEQRESAVAQARADLNACEARLSAIDPDYALKKEILVPRLKPEFAKLDPSQWVAAFEKAYQELRLLDPPAEQPVSNLVTPSTAESPASEPTIGQTAPQVEVTADARKPEEGEAAAKELLELTSSPSSTITHTQAIRDKIFELFETSTTSDQRDSLLAMFTATMNLVESHIAKSGDETKLAKFRDARADDYTRLLVNESSVDENVSTEMLMAVTNREIAAGRMKHDDPIRQLALKAAAAPHLSHAELLSKAEAKRQSDMSIEGLLDEIKTSKNLNNVGDLREKIQKEFDAAQTSDQRGKVLAIFTAMMDFYERNLPADQVALLDDFKKARAQDYKLFIVQECTVGLDSPGGGNVSVDMLMAVTNREIAAGRMDEEYSLRKIAVERAAAPHLSHAQLVAQHAELKQKVESRVEVPANTFGQKLKSFFGSKK